MTDYEIASLFAEYASILEQTFINYISVMFAFLVASYLVAHRLSNAMIGVVLVLYSAFALNQIAMMFAVSSDLRGLELLMVERISQGAEELRFHSGARNPLLGLLLGVSGFFAMVGGFVGSLWFFFLQRVATRNDA